YPLTFKLTPMTTYTVTVPAGVKDRFGRTLDQPISVTFRTGHLTPFMNPPPRQAVLELGPTPVIPLRTMNTIVPLRFGNLDQLTFNYRRLTAFGLKRGITPGASRKVNLLERPELSAPKDHIVNGSLGIRGLLDGRSGVVWGSLNWAPDSPYRPYPFVGEVTPWQMLVKVGHYNTLVWLNSFGTGRPIRGATVKLWHGHDENLGKLS